MAVPSAQNDLTSTRAGRRRRRILLLHEAGQLLRIAGPIIMSQLGGVGMTTMDTIMVGPLGPSALAAAGLASALHVAVVTITTGTLLGLGPLVSHAFGAGDDRESRRLLVQGLWLGVALTLPLMAINFFGEPIARALAQPEEVAVLTGGYMHALAFGVLPLLLFLAFRQFLEGQGIAKPAMVITFIGLGVNFVGNYALIYGVEELNIPAYEVVGSGWSTTIVRWAMLAAMCYYLFRRSKQHPFRGVDFDLHLPLLRRIVRIGAPTGLQVGLEVGLFTYAAVLMGRLGTVELAAHQVTINIAATTFMVALGVSVAGSIRVGHSIGAGSPAGVRRAVLLTFGLVLLFMGICAIAFLTIPRFLLGLYTGNAAIIGLGTSLLFWAAVFQLFDGFQVAGFSVLRGAADTRVPMLLAAVAYWCVGAPTAWVLAVPGELGAPGVWIGLCVSLAVASALLLHRIRRVLW